ncbi:MAG TPA: nucleotidyltransferase domain-containing protein [Nanoarchaeota archaeon]|nr:nucleotidyltransferase domain-containing protein [Nanoarchaeota archaeon]
MKTEIKAIKALIGQEAMTIREIARKIKADYRITHTAVKLLSKKGAISLKKAGGSLLCELNKGYRGIEIMQAEEERKAAFLKNKDMMAIYKEIMSNAKSSFFVMLVFGSYAKGSQTKHSDIDIMLVSNDGKLKESIREIISAIPLKIHLIPFSEEEFKRMYFSLESNIAKEAAKDYIILHGAEQFYEMMKP